MALRIEDYGFIGNMHTAALVGRDGSIDWLCLPRFDSAACFSAILGSADNGRWLIAPSKGGMAVRRQYREGTAILETTFQTEEGEATVIDFLADPERDGNVELFRIVRGNRGTVRMRTELVLRLDYGHVIPWLRRHDYGLTAIAGPDGLQLRTPVRLEGRDMKTRGEFDVRAGDRIPFTLTWFPSHLPLPGPQDADIALSEAEARWRRWSAHCAPVGEWTEAVSRSLITLKAMTYSPTGGIVAAPTTSLPEEIGGVRNWDYRFCWIRDATLTLYALITSGYREEARAWREWLLRAAAGEPSRLQIMYGISGERRLQEFELPWLPGYEGSAPVRVGNGAHGQLQIDVYGELMDALHVARKHELEVYEESWTLQKAIIRHLEEIWDSADAGIWEMRGPPRHFTHSRMMAWVGVDRAVKAVETFGLEGPVDRWRELRDRIHDDVCANGFDAELNSFVQYYGGKTVDASLLLMAQVGFIDAKDPRFAGTVAMIERELLVDGLVLRYRTEHDTDGLPGDEGAFLACSFWLADAYILMGRYEEARKLFDYLLSLRNDLGLLAEEYHPHGDRQLGNFPQAFSHIALVNTAQNLASYKAPARDRSDGASAETARQPIQTEGRHGI